MHFDYLETSVIWIWNFIHLLMLPLFPLVTIQFFFFLFLLLHFVSMEIVYFFVGCFSFRKRKSFVYARDLESLNFELNLIWFCAFVVLLYSMRVYVSAVFFWKHGKNVEVKLDSQYARCLALNGKLVPFVCWFFFSSSFRLQWLQLLCSSTHLMCVFEWFYFFLFVFRLISSTFH